MSDSQSDSPTTGLPVATGAPGLGGDLVVASAGGVQRKVSFASIAAYLSGLGLATVVQSLQDGSLINALPPTASAILAPIVPALLVFLTGYMTTNRADPNAVKTLAAAVQAQLASRVEALVVAEVERRFGSTGRGV